MAGYTVAEASRLLNVSPRRVRQLHASGTLPLAEGEESPAPGAPLMLDAESVHAERDRRKAAGKGDGSERDHDAGAIDVSVLLELAERITDKALDGVRQERVAMLALRDKSEEALRLELHEERARRATAEARLEELTAELADMRAKAAEVIRAEPAPEPERRRWWGGRA